MSSFEGPRRAAVVLVLAFVLVPARAQAPPIEAGPLTFADKRLPASVAECAVWQRELAFARSVEAHDAAAFAAFLHPGAVFNAGTPDAERSRDAIARSWAEIIDGRTIALRWRPGIVSIGGEASIAVSRGTFILQRTEGGVPSFRVGMFQTVWVRDAQDGVWRVLFDGSATDLAADEGPRRGRPLGRRISRCRTARRSRRAPGRGFAARAQARITPLLNMPRSAPP